MLTDNSKGPGMFINSYLKWFNIILLLTCFSSEARTYISGNPLSGEYMVGLSPTADFQSLEDAIGEINSNGISAPVQLLVAPGIYQVHLTISNFQRLGASNDVLLIRSLDPSTPATLQWEAADETDNWLIKLDGTSFVAIRNLHLEVRGSTDFANIIAIENSSTDVDIANNQIDNYVVDPFGADEQANSIVSMIDSPIANIQIRNNQFNSGSGAIKLSGSTVEKASEIKIISNVFTDQDGTGSFRVVTVNNSQGVYFQNNVIENTIENAKGVYFFRSNDVLIDANQIKMLGGGGGGSALRLNHSNDDGLSQSIVKNNTLLASHEVMSIGNFGARVKVYHNSILASGSISNLNDSAAVNISDDATLLELKNNIIHSKMTHDLARVMEVEDSSALTISDHNVFYGLSVNLFSVDGADYTSFSGYQFGTQMDANSLDLSVNFADEAAGDLHLLKTEYNNPDLITVPIEAVVFDVDGDVRLPSAPLVGADELDSDVIFTNGFE